MRKYVLLTLAVLFFSPNFLIAQKKQAPISKEAKAPLIDYISALRKDSVLEHANWSVRVVNPTNGEVVASYNGNASLQPASNMKIVTTGVGLLLLGADYRFTTRLACDGTISADSVLNGNLYIIGGGDPSLGSSIYPQTVPDSVFNKWTQALKTSGIKRVNGSIIADISQVFDNEYRSESWNWGDIGLSYGAGTGGLQYADNTCKVRFTSGNAVGDPAVISSIEPALPNQVFENYATTVKADSNTNLSVFSSPYSSRVLVTGVVPLNKKNASVDAAIPDPAYTCAWYFNSYLNRSGIATTGNIEVNRTNADASARTAIGSYTSPSLADLVNETNKSSNNCFAESILKVLAYQNTGKGSTDVGTRIVADALKKQKVKLDGFKQVDGSGLSRKDMVTTIFLCDYLTMMSKTPQFDVFQKSLPIAGVDGTLKNLLKGTAGESNVKAKSGSMESVRGYSGYVTTKGKKLLCFSIIMNNYTCPSSEITKRMEKLMRLMAEIE